MSANSTLAKASHMTQLKVKRQGSVPTTMRPQQEYGCAGAGRLIYCTPQGISHNTFKLASDDLGTQSLGLSFNRSVFLSQSLQLYVFQVLNL